MLATHSEMVQKSVYVHACMCVYKTEIDSTQSIYGKAIHLGESNKGYMVSAVLWASTAFPQV
jgi:hypothetical protein